MTPAQRAKAEAKATGLDTAPLEGHILQILPTMDWRSSAVRALRENDYDSWAQGCLTPESYDVWRTVDPTLRQCEAFFAAWKSRTGQDVGESAAS